MLEFSNIAAVTICAGVSGTGKSTFAARYLVNAPLNYRFIFDPEHEYSQRFDLEPAGDLYAIGLALCRGWVLFDPDVYFPGRRADAFAFFCELAYEKSLTLPGRKILVVDEAWKYVSTQKQPDELAACVQSGRKRGLESMFNTQNPQLLYSAIRNECSELVWFRLQDKNPLDYAQERGMDRDEISQLPDLHFVARNVQSRAELRGKIKL